MKTEAIEACIACADDSNLHMESFEALAELTQFQSEILAQRKRVQELDDPCREATWKERFDVLTFRADKAEAELARLQADSAKLEKVRALAKRWEGQGMGADGTEYDDGATDGHAQCLRELRAILGEQT